MIKILIVEDEPPIAGSIAKIIGKNYNNAEIFNAINGKRALELLKTQKIDIIFSDIKMPVVDGLALAEAVQEKYPHIIMFIITGFQEFDYARQAMEYGVSKYLLKPVSEEDICGAVNHALAIIKKDDTDNRRRDIERAINGRTLEGHVPNSFVMLLCEGAFIITPEEQLLPALSFTSCEKIEAAAEKYLHRDESCICVNGKTISEKLIIIHTDNWNAGLEAAKGLFSELTDNISPPATLAVKDGIVSASELRSVSIELRSFIYKNLRLFCPCLLIYNEEQSSAKNEVKASKAEKELLAVSLQQKDSIGIQNAVSQIVDTFVERCAKETEILLFLERTAIKLFDGIYDNNAMSEIKNELHNAVSGAASKAELSDSLAQIFIEAASVGNETENLEADKICEEIAAFIRSNYKRNITNAMLSKQFGMSAAQISKRFKERYGMFTSEYLNNFRIETAKAIMRANPDKMIKEVARDVGFGDQYYFSKTFKKITGIWPSNYIT